MGYSCAHEHDELELIKVPQQIIPFSLQGFLAAAFINISAIEVMSLRSFKACEGAAPVSRHCILPRNLVHLGSSRALERQVLVSLITDAGHAHGQQQVQLLQDRDAD